MPCHRNYELDLNPFPGPLPDIRPLFGSIARADSDFRAKPALAQWDAQFARRWVGVVGRIPNANPREARLLTDTIKQTASCTARLPPYPNGHVLTRLLCL